MENKYVDVCVDLDETLINSRESSNPQYETLEKFNIKKSVKKYLPQLYNMRFRFHVITSRCDYDDTLITVNRIEGVLKFKFSSLTCTGCGEKGIFAKGVGKYMIDDSLYKLLDCEENDVIPIHYSKSKNINGIINLKTWKDISEYLINDNKILL